jgi:hypothetical protein
MVFITNIKYISVFATRLYPEFWSDGSSYWEKSVFDTECSVLVTVTHPTLDDDFLHTDYPLPITINHKYFCLYFNPIICFKLYIICKISYFISVRWFKNFCNISIYLSFVMHLPVDCQLRGWNM